MDLMRLTVASMVALESVEGAERRDGWYRERGGGVSCASAMVLC
jgi:hypothetical protein